MTYFDLVNLDMKHQITTAAIDFIAKSCELTEDLKDAGEMTQLAVDQFKARLLELKGTSGYRKPVSAMERALCLLMGKFPEHVDRRDFYELREMQYPGDIGIPDLLLTRRPDIREAEMTLAAADCDIKAARRAFYPGLQNRRQRRVQCFRHREILPCPRLPGIRNRSRTDPHLYSTPDRSGMNIQTRLSAGTL